MQQKEAERSLEKYLKFPYESVEELKMENRLSGGEIILRSGGLESFVCAFSGGYMRENMRFKHIVDKLIKKEELNSEDIKEAEMERRSGRSVWMPVH